MESLETLREEAARRWSVLALCEEMAGSDAYANHAEALGARRFLVKALDRAMREGDEEAMTIVGGALGRCGELAKRERSVELRSVAGSQVGSRAGQPPSTLEVTLPVSGNVVIVHESAWKDAGLAWRVWGSAQIMSRILDAAPALVRNLEVLEIGAGCGLCGIVAASLGAKRSTITDGAPGALAAIQRSAAELPNATAAFLDFRDDADIIDGIVSLDDARSSNEARHWVHSRSGSQRTVIEEYKLSVDAEYDVCIATDVLYSEEHSTPLAASLSRRIRPGGTGLVLNACRHAGLLSEFAIALLARGLRVQISVAERFKGEDDTQEYQGGHLHRTLPAEAEAWWTEIARDLSDFSSLVVADEDSSLSLLADAAAACEFMTRFEGRFVLMRVRRPDVPSVNTETHARDESVPPFPATPPPLLS